MKRDGFTLIEIVIAGTVFLLLFGSAVAAVLQDRETHRALAAQFGPEMKAQQALERITTELRMAGEWAEDRDHDGELDPGEDTNDNGELDASWNLADGTIAQDNISFNRRIDLRDTGGALLASGVYSRKVAYQLWGDRLIRAWEHTREDGTVEMRRAVLARGIRGLRFSREGVLVRVALDVFVPTSAYEPGVRTLHTQIWLRN